MNMPLLCGTFAVLSLIAIYYFILLAYNRYQVMNPKILYLIRGIPGSGKSTLARKVAAEHSLAYFEADMYFETPDGYKWNAEDLGKAHNWCYDQFHLAVHNHQSVVVSNTFKRWREMREYVDYALANGYKVEIIQCCGEFGSVHGLTADMMKQQKERMIDNDHLPKFHGITYSYNVPVAECANTHVEF